MFNFNALSIYKLTELGALTDTAQLQESLIAFAYRPMSPSAISSTTIAPINGYDADYPKYLYALQDNSLKDIGVAIRFNIAKRQIPKQILTREINLRAKEYEKRHGEKPAKKDLAEIKVQVMAEIGKNIPPTEKELDIFIDFESKLVFAGSSSKMVIENCLGTLRKAIGSLPVTPVVYKKDIYEVLNDAFVTGHFDTATVLLTDKFKLNEPLETKKSITNSFVTCSLPALQEFVKNGELGITQIEVTSLASKGSYTITVPKMAEANTPQIKGLKTTVKDDLDVHLENVGDIEQEQFEEESRRFILNHVRESVLGVEENLREIFGGYIEG